jgi:hypothetical protein
VGHASGRIIGWKINGRIVTAQPSPFAGRAGFEMKPVRRSRHRRLRQIPQLSCWPNVCAGSDTVRTLREPGGTPIGGSSPALKHCPDNAAMTPGGFAPDERQPRQLVREIIRPARATGELFCATGSTIPPSPPGPAVNG